MRRQRMQLAIICITPLLVFFAAAIIFESTLAVPISQENLLDDPSISSFGTNSKREAVPVKDHRQQARTTSTGIAISTKRALFYNVFFGKTNQDVNQALRIVNKQFEQIRKANFSNAITIYYNVIGSNQTICPQDMDCQFLKFYPQANEQVTLQSLYDYCAYHPEDRVSYMHNKGSYSLRNTEFLRHHATKAALAGDQCNSSTCNVCGTVFQMAPYFHFSANMWSAECSYVRKLVPPLQYEQKRRELCQSDVVQKRMQDHDHQFCPDWPSSNNKNNSDVDDDGINKTLYSRYGFGRYAAERWIVSHPSLLPCQFFNGNFANCAKCDHDTNLIVARRAHSRFPLYYWQTLAYQLAEYEMVYNVGAQEAADGGFCKSYFRDHTKKPCTFNGDEFQNGSLPLIKLS